MGRNRPGVLPVRILSSGDGTPPGSDYSLGQLRGPSIPTLRFPSLNYSTTLVLISFPVEFRNLTSPFRRTSSAKSFYSRLIGSSLLIAWYTSLVVPRPGRRRPHSTYGL